MTNKPHIPNLSNNSNRIFYHRALKSKNQSKKTNFNKTNLKGILLKHQNKGSTVQM